MELDKVLTFLKQYGKCPQCGNEYIGVKSGDLEVTSNRIKRSCKCGWSIELKESK